jgi:hypothetical protein
MMPQVLAHNLRNLPISAARLGQVMWRVEERRVNVGAHITLLKLSERI